MNPEYTSVMEDDYACYAATVEALDIPDFTSLNALHDKAYELNGRPWHPRYPKKRKVPETWAERWARIKLEIPEVNFQRLI